MQSNSRLKVLNRLPLLSFCLTLILTIAIGIFIHYISPLRDPTYQPSSANAGSLLPWMRGVSEDQWVLGANLLAGVLASSLTVLIRHYSRIYIFRSATLAKRTTAQTLLALYWFAMGTVLYLGLTLGFFIYLLQQWIID